MTATLGDIMKTELVTFSPDDNIHHAIRVLLENRFSGAPVVDDNGVLVGILSRKDCLKVAFSSRYHDDWGGAVSEFMSPNVETLDVGMDISSAAEHFIHSNFRRFPVIDNGRMVGQVSRMDLLEYFQAMA